MDKNENESTEYNKRGIELYEQGKIERWCRKSTDATTISFEN